MENSSNPMRYAAIIGMAMLLSVAHAAPEPKQDSKIPSPESVRMGDVVRDDVEIGKELYKNARDAISAGEHVKGMQLLKQAGEKGHVLAMFHLGLYMRHDAKTPQEFQEASRWYRRAAEAGGSGFSGAQNNLGDMYETGEGVPKSAADAIYWYTRSALQGEPTAYMSLGDCFAEGIGVKKDLVEAYFWLALAMPRLPDGVIKNATKSKMTEIEQQMTPEQIQLGKRKVTEFRPYIQTKLKMGDRIERDTAK
jgi:hypothetical protein